MVEGFDGIAFRNISSLILRFHFERLVREQPPQTNVFLLIRFIERFEKAQHEVKQAFYAAT